MMMFTDKPVSSVAERAFYQIEQRFSDQITAQIFGKEIDHIVKMMFDMPSQVRRDDNIFLPP